MEIRPAEVYDIPALIELLYQVGDVHHRIRPDLFRNGARKYDEKQLQFLLLDSRRPIFVAVEENAVLGYCFCQIQEYFHHSVMTDRKELYIDDLCVEENCRGKHVGQALYDYVRAYARREGIGHITLNVWCGNESDMAFYEKQGMKKRSITMEVALEDSYAD